MNLPLSPTIKKLLTARMKSGRYSSMEDVIAAAITNLDQQENFGDFAPGELNELLAEGDRDIERGDVIDGAEVFAKLRRRAKIAVRKQNEATFPNSQCFQRP